MCDVQYLFIVENIAVVTIHQADHLNTVVFVDELHAHTSVITNATTVFQDGSVVFVDELHAHTSVITNATTVFQDGSVKCGRRECSEVNCLNPVTPPGQCCPVCSSACLMDGQEYQDGERFPNMQDDCSICTCNVSP